MIDFSTYFIYTLFPLIIILLSSNLISIKKNTLNFDQIDFSKFGIYFIILFYTIFVGLRYRVGKDYEAYEGWFLELKRTGVFPVNNDFGYIWMNKFFVNFGFESYFLFLVLAFLQILFIFLFLKKLHFIRNWFFFFFFTSLLFFMSMNIMRQTLAFFMFIYCIQLFYNKQFFKTLIVALIAFSFHKTVIILLILLPFLKIDWFKNIKYHILILLLSVFIIPNYFTYVLEYLDPIIKLLGYDYYIENLDLMLEITEENKKGAGMSKFLFFFLDLFIIFFSKKLKKLYKQYNFIQFYNLYFVGVILSRMFEGNFILERISDYFIYFRVLILSFLVFYIFNVIKDKKGKIIKPIALFFCLILLLFYYKAIFNNAADIAPFQFIFNYD